MNPDRTNRVDYAIGLVIYHPEASLLNRIGQIIELGFRVYVFDNSPFDEKYTKTIKNAPNICYLTAGKNIGIGYSLATLCATAHAHGYQRLLFLDQDTGISNSTLEFIEAYPKTMPLEIQQQYAALVFNGKPAPNNSIKEVRLAISSGSLFNLPALRQIGWHNENYFVDCVDYELCLRARRCGFKIGIVNNTPDFDHVTEQPDWALHIFGKQLLVRRYSASRIKDAIGAYLKLIVGGLLKNRPGDTYALARSMGLYIFGQLTARLIKANNRNDLSSN
jgi:rhamnosyltransferase